MTTSTTAITPQFVLQPGCTEIEFLGLQFNGIYDDNGDPWFLAHDAALQLGFEQERYATRYLDADKIKTAHGLLKGRKVKGLSKNTKFVSERGFYKLIFESRKPEAVAFQDWVFDVVLPYIFDRGYYILGMEHMSEEEIQKKKWEKMKKAYIRKQEEKKGEKYSDTRRALLDSALDVAGDILKEKDQGSQTQIQ
jgi:prophage antirepressor-like protein